MRRALQALLLGHSIALLVAIAIAEPEVDQEHGARLGAKSEKQIAWSHVPMNETQCVKDLQPAELEHTKNEQTGTNK